MTFPTPTGAPPLSTQLTTGWTSEPTTQASFNYTVALITSKLGASKGAAFRAWYTLAWHADPALTPDQAVTTWYVGSTLQEGIGGTAQLVVNTPGAVAGAAEANPLVQAAGSVSNPLGFLGNIADFFARLTEANTWIRIAEFAIGAGLVIVGVAHLAKNTPVGKAAAKTAKTVGLAAAL